MVPRPRSRPVAVDNVIAANRRAGVVFLTCALLPALAAGIIHEVPELLSHPSPASCGPLASRLHCIDKAVPVLDTADCSAMRWSVDTVDLLPYSCTITTLTPPATAALLNGTSVMFFGTGCRYSAYTLLAHLTGNPFTSYSLAETVRERARWCGRVWA